jgi:uncharacterized protein with von Willebrand factor type A (vWA) domain
MTVNLTPHAEELLQQVMHSGSPEQVVEEALERLVAEQGGKKKGMTADEAVNRIRKLRKGITLGGISVEELVNEGRKH